MKIRHHGFTLIELMITIAIVGVLAALAYPSYFDQIAKGRRSECRGALLQVMQQQERYYTQRNSYAAYATTASSAPARLFSGDKRENSACSMSSVACSGDGSADVKQCIEARAATVKDPAGISYIYLDSDGRKGCEVNSVRTTANTSCWP